MDIILSTTTLTAPEKSAPLVHRGDYYLNILSCLGYSSNEMPVADLLKELHGLKGDWLVASPICWQATHNDVMMMASGEGLQCLEEEGQAWFAVLTELTTMWGFKAVYHNAYTWLIQPSKAPLIQACPVYHLYHQSMMPALEALDKTMYWQRLLTEAQLLFSAHSLNRQRSKQLPINGIWFWGGGHFCQQTQRMIIVQDESLRPLAQVLSKTVQIETAFQRYPNDALLLLNHLDPAISKKIDPRHRHAWYWNNQAYETRSVSWIRSFLKKLKP